MTLPNFLGIGASRSGTTWLYEVMRTNPDVFMPKYRKEIHFFTDHYERGVRWYEKFFPKNKEDFKAIGEFTAKYLYSEDAPRRIKETLGENCKFIVVLRNPAERAFSSYKKHVKMNNYQKNFSDFLEENPKALKRGFYSEHLSRWLSVFSRENFLIILSYDMFSDPDSVLERVSTFLGVSNNFNIGLKDKKVNAGYIPKFPKIVAFSKRIREGIENSRFNFLIEVAHSLRIPKLLLLKSSEKVPSMSKKDRKKLLDVYEKDMKNLEKITNIKVLSKWKSKD